MKIKQIKRYILPVLFSVLLLVLATYSFLKIRKLEADVQSVRMEVATARVEINKNRNLTQKFYKEFLNLSETSDLTAQGVLEIVDKFNGNVKAYNEAIYDLQVRVNAIIDYLK